MVHRLAFPQLIPHTGPPLAVLLGNNMASVLAITTQALRHSVREAYNHHPITLEPHLHPRGSFVSGECGSVLGHVGQIQRDFFFKCSLCCFLLIVVIQKPSETDER